MNKLNGQSEDILKDNIAALRDLFPEVCCEGKVNFDKLKQVLGDYTDDSTERYNFTWNGKGQALRLSQTPSMGTLRPCKEESKNWDNTQNLYIEGDNLEVLKLLQKSYHGKIKMIYIDPPYNTGSDFVYPDDFSDSLENYKQITGQVDAEGRRISTNSEANGRYHTDWLNMMYPRLRLARNLLTDDGVIFISIDDNEVTNFRKICDEAFGEENFLACLIWEKTRKNDARFFSSGHDYMIVYAKSEAYLREAGTYWREAKAGADDIYHEYESLRARYGDDYKAMEAELREFYNNLPKDHPAKKHSRYNKVDDRGVWRDDNMSWPGGGGPFYDVIHPVTGKPCKVPPGGWRFSTSEKMQQMIAEGVVVFRDDDTEPPIKKTYLVRRLGKHTTNDEESVGKQVMGSYFYRSFLQSTTVINELLGKNVFEYPKDHEVIKRMVNYVTRTDENDIILDFFSGSATTAHAVMQLNAEDGGNRRFILVQLPEVCDEKSEAYKAGYNNICEIGKERIRRAGEKSKAEIEEQNAQLKIGEEPKKAPDIGFKDFKLDSSNLKKWNPDYNNLEQSLFDSVGNYVDDRTELDVVYEIMLKMGLDLTWPLETRAYGGKNVYTIGLGALMICLDDHITPDVAEAMVSLHKELAPETWKVVFKDNGFADDSAKVNIKEILKCAGLEEDAFTTV